MIHDFEVWAPTPRRVELVVDGVHHPMDRTARGWWRASVKASWGSRYGFSLDGGATLADPRSCSQPEGIESLSELVDLGDFEWRDGGWTGFSLRDAVLYECHVGTFSPEGTFDGVVRRLDHLVELGVDAIELMPVAAFPGTRGWGYDGVAPYAPHAAYGGPGGMRRLVDACHARGLGVVLDVVYNHFGPSGNHLEEFGPYFTDEHTTTWGKAVNFEGEGSTDVRRFMVDNAKMWIRDYHVDGLRLDAVHAITDRSAVHVLEELTTEVRVLAGTLGRDVAIIAECELNDPRYVRTPYAGGYGCDASWADDWHHALHALLTGERDRYYEDYGSLDQLAKALRQAWVYDGEWSPHRQRVQGRSPRGLESKCFVVALQNHDQIGNRAVGERLSSLTSPGRLRIAAALLLMSPFVPLLFQGEEWGTQRPFLYFTNHSDPELGAKVTDARREEFAAAGWSPDDIPDPQQESTFSSSVLQWVEIEKPDHAEMLEWYRQLIELRHTRLPRGDPGLMGYTVRCESTSGRLETWHGHLRTLVNLGRTPWRAHAAGLVLARSDPGIEHRGGLLHLPPDTVAIVSEPETVHRT